MQIRTSRVELIILVAMLHASVRLRYVDEGMKNNYLGYSTNQPIKLINQLRSNTLTHLPHLVPNQELIVGRVDGGLEQSILPLLGVCFTGGLDKVLGGESTALKIWGVRGRGRQSLRGLPGTE